MDCTIFGHTLIGLDCNLAREKKRRGKEKPNPVLVGFDFSADEQCSQNSAVRLGNLFGY